MTIIKIELSKVIRRTQEAVVSELDGEVVMMSIEQGEYYGLGQVGSVIWRLMEQPISVQEIIQECMKQYDVDSAQCEQDVLPFLTQLHQKGLVSYS